MASALSVCILYLLVSRRSRCPPNSRFGSQRRWPVSGGRQIRIWQMMMVDGILRPPRSDRSRQWPAVPPCRRRLLPPSSGLKYGQLYCLTWPYSPALTLRPFRQNFSLAMAACVPKIQYLCSPRTHPERTSNGPNVFVSTSIPLYGAHHPACLHVVALLAERAAFSSTYLSTTYPQAASYSGSSTTSAPRRHGISAS